MVVTIKDLPEEMIMKVLSLVPAWDLVRHCRFVCSRWRSVADTLNQRWKHKCLEKGFVNPNYAEQDWKTFYFLCSMKKNLIQNPYSEDGLDYCEIEDYAEFQWMIEEPDRFPIDYLTPCFIASPSGFGLRSEEDPSVEVKLGHKTQLVTLKDHGYWDELMDHVKPDIVMKDWSDADDRKLNVKLLSADHQVLCQCQGTDLTSKESKEYSITVSYTFRNYPPGVRHILFEHEFINIAEGAFTCSSITVGPEFIRVFDHDVSESDLGDLYETCWGEI